MTHEDVLESLQKTFQFKNYIISKEKHANGGAHFHVILIAEGQKKFDIKTAHALDLLFQGTVLDVNDQSVNKLFSLVDSICKQAGKDEDDFLTNMEDIKDGQLMTLDRTLIEKAREESVDEAVLWLAENHLHKGVANAIRRNKNLEFCVKT